MNRQIKFRGLRTDGKGWVYGDLIHGVNHKAGKMYILPIKGGIQSLSSGIDPIDGWEVKPETVGQYTGLKDSEGVEIYEGDIVKCPTAVEPEDKGFICQYKDYRWKFNNVRYADDFYGTVNYEYINKYCKVIGTIHDNTEIIENK